VWKQAVFSKNLRLTAPFFKKNGVNQPKYFAVLKNMLHDVFDFVFKHPKNIAFYIDKNSVHILEEMRQGGIFLTAHYGNHEFLGYRLAELKIPLNAAAQKQKPDFFDRWLQKKRTFNGKCFAKEIEPESLISFIDSGGLFAMLADQNFKNSSKCEGEFLGVSARCNPVPAFILKHRPNTPVFCGYLKQTTLFLKKIPADNFYAHYHSWLESLILENPAKWYGWFHNRFKI